jgi:hypothetical protein
MEATGRAEDNGIGGENGLLNGTTIKMEKLEDGGGGIAIGGLPGCGGGGNNGGGISPGSQLEAEHQQLVVPKMAAAGAYLGTLSPTSEKRSPASASILLVRGPNF